MSDTNQTASFVDDSKGLLHKIRNILQSKEHNWSRDALYQYIDQEGDVMWASLNRHDKTKMVLLALEQLKSADKDGLLTERIERLMSYLMPVDDQQVHGSITSNNSIVSIVHNNTSVGTNVNTSKEELLSWLQGVSSSGPRRKQLPILAFKRAGVRTGRVEKPPRPVRNHNKAPSSSVPSTQAESESDGPPRRIEFEEPDTMFLSLASEFHSSLSSFCTQVHQLQEQTQTMSEALLAALQEQESAKLDLWSEQCAVNRIQEEQDCFNDEHEVGKRVALEEENAKLRAQVHSLEEQLLREKVRGLFDGL